MISPGTHDIFVHSDTHIHWLLLQKHPWSCRGPIEIDNSVVRNYRCSLAGHNWPTHSLPVSLHHRDRHCFPRQRPPTQSTHHAACYAKGNKISFTCGTVVSASDPYGHDAPTILRSEEQPGRQSWAKLWPTGPATSATQLYSFRELPIQLCLLKSAWRTVSSFFGPPGRRL